MHADINQITEGKVLDGQVKTKIFETFQQSCFCLMKQAVNAPIWGRFVNAMGSVASCYALS